MSITKYPSEPTVLSEMPIGSIIAWPSDTLPAGWLVANGSAVSRSQYADFFTKFGTTWGSGNGSTTFNIPFTDPQVLPWNAPRGRVAFAQVTSSTASFSTTADLSGLSVTFTAYANRRYKITGYFSTLLFPSVANEEVNLMIRDGSNTQISQTRGSSPSTAKNTPGFQVQAVVTPGTGSKTYKLSASAVSGTAQFFADATQPGFILVEDLGADTTQSPYSNGEWIVKMFNPAYTTPEAPYQVVTSSTRPGGSAGLAIYETDTENFLIYDGTSYQAPWNLSWGVVAVAAKTSNQASITTIADVTSLSATWTAVAGRRYEVILTGHLQVTNTDTVARLVLTYSDNTFFQIAQSGFHSANVAETVVCSTYLAPSAGSITIKARCERVVGTGSVQVTADALYPGTLIVKDIGPA